MLRQQSWVEVREIQHQLLSPVLLELGRGEAEAIALAQALGAELLMDDLLARRVARQLQIPCFGTLALLGRAKRAGAITRIRPLIDQLRANGIFISDALIRSVLTESGE